MSKLVAIALAVGGLLVTGSARADNTLSEEELIIDWGMSASVGGGVTGFADAKTRDFINVGGTWEARLAVGTRKTIAFEGAYIGGAQSIDTLGLDADAMLLSTGIEGNVRLNLLRGDAWQPYVLTGVGWKRYDVTNTDVNTSSVAGDDNVVEVPFGAGVSYRYSRLLVDARVVVRGAFDDDLIATAAGEEDSTLHNWTTTLRIGTEF